MSTESKDTIYIDVDDEITSIIDKLQNSPKKIVALVLPKRAAMLQSIVNMKLLERTAKSSKKNIVLITSDPNLLPLAGAVGLHVAKTLQSKPIIPPAPDKNAQNDTLQINDPDEALDTHKSIGELAGLGPDKEDEVIEVDNSELEAAGAAAEDLDKEPPHGGKTSKKLKIPNFEQFRTRLFLIIAGVILLFAGWFWAFVVSPKAHVLIKTDTSSQTVNTDFTAQTDTETVNLESKILPAKTQEIKKSDQETVPATGQKDLGDKAKGTMTVYNCTDSNVSVPAGTTFADTVTGLSFSTNTAVTVPFSDFTSGGTCKKNNSANVAVTATQAGDKYNLSGGRSYTSNFATTLSGNGSAMTGGTSRIVKVVGTADLDSAKQKIAAKNQNVSAELRAALTEQSMVGITDTLANDEPKVTSSPKVGEEANEVTVTVEITYKMLGIKQDDLKNLISAEAALQIDTEKQMVTDADLNGAIFRLGEKKAPNLQKVSLQTIATIGPKLDEEALKKAILGKKRGEAEGIIANRPGVKEVQVSYKPFWVTTTPKSAKKITIVIEPTKP